MLLNTAEKYANNVAIVYGEQKITFANLVDRVTMLSAGFKSIGMQTGDCVAIFMSNRPEFIESFYAISCNNAIALTLNPLYKADELIAYLMQTDAKFIISDSAGIQTCRQAVGKINKKIQIIVLGDTANNEISYEELLTTHISMNTTNHPLYRGEVVYQYSSGSTGQAKCIVRTQQHLLEDVNIYVNSINMSSDDVTVGIVPLNHLYGFELCVLAPICSGSKLILLEPSNLAETGKELPIVSRMNRVFELIESEKVTILPGNQIIYQGMIDSDLRHANALDFLRFCFSAGSFLPQHIFEGFKRQFGLYIRQLYGSTETGVITINLHEDVDNSSYGTPLNNVNVKVIDENANPITEQYGEVLVKSPSVTQGYLKLSELNSKVFKDGWFHTGDLGMLDRENNLFLSGRKVKFISTGGYKVDPLEVEKAIKTYYKVKEVIVFGVPNTIEDEVIKAVVTLKEDCEKNEILAHCRSLVADYKLPKIIEFRDELPRDNMGKILKKHLMDSYQPNELLSQSLASKELNAEELQHIIKTILIDACNIGNTIIELNRPFGEYGLNSINVFDMKDRIEKKFNITFSPILFWNYPTIESMSAYLADIIQESN
ncbi:AMP-binding protein [Paenibacillus illinoisensis]|uniref:AMP-binding protein n=1 Tax=Paenibacillus illinoisensis TaxID=59845 RepID=UPI00301ABFAA